MKRFKKITISIFIVLLTLFIGVSSLVGVFFYNIALNANYPNGLTGEDKGKVITAGTYNNDKNFFAYDYDENTWYYLGSLSGVTDFTEAFLFASENDANIESKKNTLKNGGVWFVIEEI